MTRAELLAALAAADGPDRALDAVRETVRAAVDKARREADARGVPYGMDVQMVPGPDYTLNVVVTTWPVTTASAP